MKKSGHTKVVQLLPIILLSLICFNANAQKLPSTQKISLWAPDHIIIDGKATEWGGKFQAYNSANHLFYTIANDNKNLYLIVQSYSDLAVQKITRWGITFTINSSLKKNAKDINNISISFPIEYEKGVGIIRGVALGYLRNKSLVVNKDSLQKALNEKIVNAFKLIQISGVKGIDNGNISVYNSNGIKAAALFDDKITYTYELAIPLKYLNGSINEGTPFSYNIKLNAPVINPRAPLAPMRVDGGRGPAEDDQDYLFNPTDFWGEYTLAKK